MFCQYRDASFGEDFLLWMRADGDDYALNPIERFPPNDGDAKDWESIWSRKSYGDRYISP